MLQQGLHWPVALQVACLPLVAELPQLPVTELPQLPVTELPQPPVVACLQPVTAASPVVVAVYPSPATVASRAVAVPCLSPVTGAPLVAVALYLPTAVSHAVVVAYHLQDAAVAVSHLLAAAGVCRHRRHQKPSEIP